MDEQRTLSTIEQIKAFSDPYRIQIINCFYRIGEPATVKQVADELGEVPANVHYHVKKLESAGILHLIHTKEINGIIAKYYEPTAKNFAICRPELEAPISASLLNEAQKFITSAYSSSQKIFLENMGEPGTGRNSGTLTATSLFLTETEFFDFQKYINNFCEKHGVKGKDNNKKEYHFFSTILEIRK